jgi:hypothetical protein
MTEIVSIYKNVNAKFNFLEMAIVTRSAILPNATMILRTAFRIIVI